MSSQLDDFQMDIDRLMPILRSPMEASRSNGKEGHWVSENTYDIPGGKVESTQETSIQRGQGWHTQSTKQTTLLKQDIDGGTGFKIPAGAVQVLPNAKQASAVKLLNELDKLAAHLGTDLENAKVTQTAVTTSTQSKTIKLNKVSSPYHGMQFDQAVKSNYLNVPIGMFTDFSGKTWTLSEAFEKDLVNPDSAVFIDPANGQMITVHQAMQQGIMEKTGHYRETSSGKRLSLEECLARCLVVSREVEPLPLDHQKKEERYEYHVSKVIDPSTGEFISVEEAVRKGVFDPVKGKYFNWNTGELLSVPEAIEKNLMVAASLTPDTSVSSSAKLIKTSKSFNIVGAIHPIFKKRLSLNEAINEGILDRSSGVYVDTLNNKKYKIQEAIQKGFVLAEEAPHQDPDSEIVTHKETTLTVTAVIHPTTGEKLSIAKASELGILDSVNGRYVNIDTGQSISLNDAIEKQLVLTERGLVKREERDRKVSSLHIEEDEEEIWTVVEEVKTETKKWMVTSVTDPRTKEKISFDDALLEGILDQENGTYCNPDTGEEMMISKAIELNLIQGELVSVNMDEEEYSSFQASADTVEHVRDPRTHKTITYDAALKLGLIDADARTFHNPVTGQTLSFQEASQRGFIKRKQAALHNEKAVTDQTTKRKAPQNSVEASKDKFEKKRTLFEEVLHKDVMDSATRDFVSTTSTESNVRMMNSGQEVSKKATTPNRELESGSTYQRQPVNSSLLSKVDEVLDRAKMYTDESVISSTETHLLGFTTDWQKERVFNLRSGEELTLDEAVSRGILDGKQVQLMRDFKKAHTPSSQTRISETRQVSETRQMSTTSGLAPSKPSHFQSTMQPLNGEPISFSIDVNKENRPPTRDSNVSMTVKVSQVQQSHSRLGPLSYDNAVRLGLFNIKTGRFRDPTTCSVLSIQDSVSHGFIQANGDAIRNLCTGTSISLADCIQRNLIDADTGKIFESKLKQLSIAVPNQFMASLSVTLQPIHFEDALKVGLLNPHTAEFCHAQSDESSSLGEAVAMRHIAGKSVVVHDPTSGVRYYLDEALRRGIIHPTTGCIMNINTGAKVMSLYDAIKAKMFESVYDPYDNSVLDINTGVRVDVNQAVKRSLLGSDTCFVYDTEKGKQVSFDEAVQSAIIDRHSAMYDDRKGGRRLACKTAVEMGLIEPVGAPVLTKLRVLDCIHKMYNPGDSISAPAYTMFEDVRSCSVSAVRKPEIRTEMETQEYKTERTVKLSKGDEPKAKHTMIDVAPGDKILTPRPYQPSSAPKRAEKVIPSPSNPSAAPSSATPNGPVQASKAPVVEEPVQKAVKPPVESAMSPKVSSSALNQQKIISFTEERVETVEKRQAKKPARNHVDNISAPEYFTKGETVDIRFDDEHPLDTYKVDLSTQRPGDIDLDLNILQRPGKQQNITKVIEEVIEEVHDTKQQQERDMPIKIESREKSLPPPPKAPVEEEVEPNKAPPVRDGHEQASPTPSRIRDKEIIIIEREGGNITKNIDINITNALEEGYIDLTKREFTHPVSGEKMSLVEALQRGFIKGSNDDIRSAIVSHYERTKLNRPIMEYSTKQEFSSFIENEAPGMSVADAIAEKRLDTRTGKFTDSSTGRVYSLADAVDNQLIDGSSAQFTNPGNKKLYTLAEALKTGKLDAFGMWTSPLTGTKQPFSDALKKGHLRTVSSEQTINKVTTITEVKKVAVNHVIHPVTMEPVDFNLAVREGVISTVEGIYKSPVTGDCLPLDEAMKRGLISGDVLDTRRKTEEKVLNNTNVVSQMMSDDEASDREQLHESSVHLIRSPTKSFVIDTVVDPRTQNLISAGEAIKLGIIDPATATFINITTGERLTFEEAIKRGLLRCMETTQLPEENRFNILGVICPRTGQELSMSQALDDGVLDFKRGLYVNTQTGRTFTFSEAIEKGLIRAEGKVPEGLTTTNVQNEESEDVTDATFTENKTYTIAAAKDTNTGQFVNIKEAVKRGILVSDLSAFNDLVSSKVYTIQEAIDLGFLQAELEDPSKPKKSVSESSTTVKTTKVFDIEAVVDPKTNEQLSAMEAVKRGIIDEATGDYVNVDTMESWSMDSAIQKGLVKAKPIPASDTVSFSISAVIDPKTGETMTVSEALRHGFLDRGRKHFCNAYTGEKCSLEEAVSHGWVQVKSNYEKQRTGLQLRGQPRPVHSGSGIQSFTILSVLDAKTGEDLTVAQAVQRHILDSSRRNYRDTLTGEIMSLDTAIKRNFIKLAPSSTSVTKLTFSEALRRGYINSQTGKYACPKTGQIMSVDEAVRRGMIVDEAGHPLGGEMAIKPTVAGMQTTSFESALRHGMIDTRSGKFRHPVSGEDMTLGRAVHQGHLQAPKTQWKAYSYRTHTSTAPASNAMPLTPASPNSLPLYKDDPIYSTIHKRHLSTNSATDGILDMYTAKEQGLINDLAGEITIPQYGTSMLIDDAILQGLVTVGLPAHVLASRSVPPHTPSVYEAFQQGLVNPVTLAVRNNATGQYLSFEDALLSGVITARASNAQYNRGTMPHSASGGLRDGSTWRETSTQREAAIPKGATLPLNMPPPPVAGVSEARHFSYRSQTQQSGSLPPNVKPPISTQYTTSTPKITPPQRKVWHQQSFDRQNFVEPVQSPLLNGNAHFVNGRLYASRLGYKLESDGTVINLSTGEKLSLQQAQRLNIVQQIPDDEHEREAYGSSTNRFFNRDVVPPHASLASPLDKGFDAFDNCSNLCGPILPFSAALNTAVHTQYFSSNAEHHYAEIIH